MWFLLIGCLLLGLSGAVPASPKWKVPTVSELDPVLYAGRYYQTYASLSITGTFERHGVCITATYGVIDASTLSVTNAMRLYKPDGKLSAISGFAKTTERPGVLSVSLKGGVGSTDNYWVMRTGPVGTYGGKRGYAYSLVTDAFGASLYVLVRDVQEAKEKYHDEILAWVKEQGFTGYLTRPRPTYHGKDCLYPAMPDLSPADNTLTTFKQPTTVEELDLSKYVGRWYQMYASIQVQVVFEKSSLCSTATYSLPSAATNNEAGIDITVYNHGRLKKPDGEVFDISGTATTTDDAGKLKLNLGFFIKGDYWVMRLGPVRKNSAGVEQYAYSLVTTPNGRQLYVLARDYTEFRDLYEEEVLEWLKNNGYNRWINRPRLTYQGKDCVYPPEI